jgi:hypothetical protein
MVQVVRNQFLHNLVRGLTRFGGDCAESLLKLRC